MLLTGTHYRSKTYTQTELNRFLKTIFYANGNKNKARVAGLISKKYTLKPETKKGIS